MMVNKSVIVKIFSLVLIFAFFIVVSPFLKSTFDKSVLGIEDSKEKDFIKAESQNLSVENSNEIPLLELYIDSSSQKKLDQKKTAAISLGGYLFSSSDDYVKAYVNTDQGTKKSKVRLKGDWADHFKNRVPSLRIQIKKGTFEGLSNFTIQEPNTRNGYRGMLLYSLLHRYDVMAIRQFPVKVRINDEYRGVVLLESHFSDPKIFEINKRRPGIIFKSYEDFIWKQRSANKQARQHIFDQKRMSINDKFLNNFMGNHPNIRSVLREFDFQFNYNNTPFRVYNEKNINKNGSLKKDYYKALGLIRGYQEGHLKNEDIFDMEKLAYYVAISNLFSTWHGQVFSNFKLYWNPYIERFEPVSFDNFVDGKQEFRFYQPFFFRVLTSPLFLNSYKKVLVRLQQEVDSIIAELKNVESDIIKKLGIQGPTLRVREQYWSDFRRKLIYLSNNVPLPKRESQKMEFFETPVLNENANINDPFVLYKVGNDIEIVNTINKPIQILSLESKDQRNILPQTVLLPASINKLGKSYLRGLSSDVSSYWIDYKFGYKSHRKKFKVLEYVYPTKRFSRCENEPLPSFVQKINAFNYQINKGKWAVENNICLLDGNNNLHINSGAELIFSPGVMLKLNGNLIVNGINEEPVVFTSNSHWRGLLVTNSTTSLIKNAKISNGKVIEEYPYSGFINFFRSNVKFENVKINNIDAEDTINLISSNFLVNGIAISKVRSDSIDFDFSDGTIRDSNFRDIGGDALDFSYANAKVINSHFFDINDKAISAGEESNINISNIDVNKSHTGVASKDGSNVIFNNGKLFDVDNGVLVYKKKGLYEGASLKANNLKFDGIEYEGLCHLGSQLSVNGKKIKCDLAKLYDSYDMSKAK